MIRDAGTNMSRPREIGHFISFETEEEARAPAETVPPEYDVEVYETEAWMLRAWHGRANEEYLAAARAWWEEFARQHGSEYDGWDADADPPTSNGPTGPLHLNPRRRLNLTSGCQSPSGGSGGGLVNRFAANPHEDMCDALAAGRVVLIVGAGLTLASTDRPEGSWDGLLTSAIDYCQAIDAIRSDQAEDLVRQIGVADAEALSKLRRA
jgi:hypothetical protein